MGTDVCVEKVVSKLLSGNDIGETGSHQAGILVPKDPEILSFFPSLDCSVKNPRKILRFKDVLGDSWNFNFIYYNSKKFGGTRNEFRLTGMTSFIRRNNLKPGDSLILKYNNPGELFITYERANKHIQHEEKVTNKPTRIKLAHTWKIITI